MHGLILKGIGSFYTVLTSDGGRYVCRARGKFRKEGVSPVPGDNVEFELSPEKDSDGYLMKIEPRKNLLIRPAVANVDKLIIVIAASLPRPDLLLVDKLLLQCEQMKITPVICVNKCDESDDAAQILAQYAPSGYKAICVSAMTGYGLDELRTELAGCVSCFSGQSAVGKSSILNALLPELDLLTGGLSRKTDRGRHTTRHAELWPVFGGVVADTPGFSLFELDSIEPEKLALLYPEMRAHLGECRFSQCLHIKEPDCAVKPLLLSGELSNERHARYTLIMEELKEKRKHKYD